jgi:hypothetical protein
MELSTQGKIGLFNSSFLSSSVFELGREMGFTREESEMKRFRGSIRRLAAGRTLVNPLDSPLASLLFPLT